MDKCKELWLQHGSRAVVLGGRGSGQAAVRLLIGRGVAVAVYDEGELQAQAAELFDELGVQFCAAAEPSWAAIDLCVVSPGISYRHRWVREARVAGVVVMGELELGAGLCHCPIVAVTGTNGKTTCVQLVEQLLRGCGLRVAAGGNIG